MQLRKFAVAAIAASSVALGACDIKNPLEDVEVTVDVQDAPINVSSEASLQLESGVGAARHTTVSVGDDIDEVKNLKEINFDKSFFQFTAAPGSSQFASLVSATGTVQFVVALGGIPVPGMPITVHITNNVVDAVSPTSITLGSATYDASSIQQLLNTIPADQRPDFSGDWASLTADQALERIQDALSGSAISLDVIAYTGDLDGTLQLNKLTIDATVASQIGD